MIILTNNDLPQKALEKLSVFGKIILLETNDQVYNAISNHPDIFCCQVGEELIIAPNIPEIVKQQFIDSKIKFAIGNKKAEGKYPNTAIYNVVVTKNYIIGNKEVMDESLLELTSDRNLIHIKQAYTRCNLLPLPGDRFITSDLGIFKQLKNNNLEILFVEPNGIVLNGFKNGFFGGCCGVYGKRLFIAGSLRNFAQGEKIRKFLNNMEIIELYNGPLLDVGSILLLTEHE